MSDKTDRHNTQGHRLLEKKAKGQVQAEMARKASLDVHELNHLIRRRRGASLRQAVALRDAYKIPVESWLKAAPK